MAAVFKLSDRVDEVDAMLRDLDADAGAVFERLGELPARLSVHRVQRYRDRLNAIEVAALAQVIDDNGDAKVAEKIVGKSGKVSKRAKKAAVARAKVGKKNPAIADKMATGDLTDEQVDIIADTDRKTDGAAATSAAFIDAIAKAGIDRSRGVAADFITDTADADGTQTEHDRQRLLRKATKFTTDRRTEAIMFEGDAASINEIWSAASKRADEFYRRDGGRDLALRRHPRTQEQRLFDALAEIFKHGIDGATPAPPCQAPETPPPAASKRHTPRVTTSRATLVVHVTLDKFLGLDPDAAAEIIGTGPIADSVLANYVNDPNTDIVGMLFGHRGQPLWHGRNIRLATHAQHTALVIRDKRCVLCGAHHRTCNAHHITPWNAPAMGETDITKLVLVCECCHRQLHDEKQTMYQDADTKHWHLRPALPHEIAPPRPPSPNRGQAPQRT